MTYRPYAAADPWWVRLFGVALLGAVMVGGAVLVMRAVDLAIWCVAAGVEALSGQ